MESHWGAVFARGIAHVGVLKFSKKKKFLSALWRGTSVAL